MDVKGEVMSRLKVGGALLGLLALAMAYASPSWAEKRYIKATYSYNTGKLTYDLPSVPYCRYFPSVCNPGHELAHTVELPFHFSTQLSRYNGIHQRLNISYPYYEKYGTLSSASGGSYRFSLQILAMAVEVSNDWVNARHPLLGWPDAEAACTAQVSPKARTMVALARKTSGSGVCYGMRPGTTQDNLIYEVRTAGAAFRLDVPSLKSMVPGVYTGSIRYAVGGHYAQDFGLGPGVVRQSTDSFELEVQLTVRAGLKVDFPAGSDHAELKPAGGWQAWANGQIPPELARDLPFRISANGPFTVKLQCGGPICYLRKTDGSQVPVNGWLSMPGVTWQGAPVANTAIGTAMRRFEVPRAIVNSPSVLHLKVRDVGYMFRYPGTYQGQVTVVFDAAI